MSSGGPTGAGPALRLRLTCRRISFESMASRVSIALMGLAAFGCLGRQTEPDNQFSTSSALFFLVFLLVAVVVFLLCTGIIVLVDDMRRRRRRLAKIFVAILAGSMCGAFWVLLVDTVVKAARPGASIGPAVLGVGVVTAMSAAILLSRPDSLSEVRGLSVMTIGFHSLVLPIGALIAFLVGGAQWSQTTSARPPVTAVILGIRLAGDPSTVGLSVGGLLSGLFLVFLGERVLRGAGRRMSKVAPRFDLNRFK
jgi:hypothetical protein